jgi:hypothetical protein
MGSSRQLKVLLVPLQAFHRCHQNLNTWKAPSAGPGKNSLLFTCKGPNNSTDVVFSGKSSKAVAMVIFKDGFVGSGSVVRL